VKATAVDALKTTTTPGQFRTLAQTLEECPWLTERYLRRLVAERRVPFYKCGGRLLFIPAEIEARVQASRVDAVQ